MGVSKYLYQIKVLDVKIKQKENQLSSLYDYKFNGIENELSKLEEEIESEINLRKKEKR